MDDVVRRATGRRRSGGTTRSTSGWVSDPGWATIRFVTLRAGSRRTPFDNGVASLTHETAFDRASVVEAVNDEGNVLPTAPLHPA